MLSFQYKHGDRPLEGYTIERGAGRGGFGEVYYAVSDTGREVALKVLQAYEQIELRGVSHCMNLKNPHLVTIFDVRYNDQRRPFVIMEYVAGPSLRQLLDEAPAGLGTQKAAFFLREMGKGLTFLHDHGIVHRDLKPANVFYESGYVKIGDYGLSKLIATTHTSAQTVTVGTVHYMAPEIGAGKYDRGIDIYALGAVLYEMLTGMVPYTGATPSEVLLKHLGSEPDVTGIPEPFAGVIRKAMAKDATQRYQSVQEMVEAVFGTEHVRQSVSVFSPDQLSVVAAHATARAPVGAAVAVGAGGGSSAVPPAAVAHGGGRLDRVGERLGRVGGRLAQFGDRMVDLGVRAVGRDVPAGGGFPSHTMAVDPPASDTLTSGQRRVVALIAAIAAGLLGACVTVERRSDPFAVFLFVALATLGGAFGIRLAVRRLMPQLNAESEAVHRIGAGGLATLCAAICSFPLWVSGEVTRNLPGLWLAIGAPLFVMDVAAWSRSERGARVTFWDKAFLAALFGFILSAMFLDGSLVPAVTLAAISLVTQILAPWDGKVSPPPVPVEKPSEKPAEAGPARANASDPQPDLLQRTAAQIEAKLNRRLDHAARRLERRRWRESRPRRERRFSFFSPIAVLFLVGSVAATLACALHLPQAIQAGLPDPSFGRDADEFFAGVDDWPRLVTRLAAATATLLTILAAAASAMARRRAGILHILRGVLGVGALVASLATIGMAFRSDGWTRVAYHVHESQPAAAIADFVDAFDAAALACSALMFVAATIILAWPARRGDAAGPEPLPQPATTQGAAT